MRRSHLAGLLACVLGLVLHASAGTAAPSGDDLDKLRKELTTLEHQYGGDLAQLRDTQHAAQLARTKSKDLANQVAAAHTAAAQLAAAQYKHTAMDSLLASGDPSTALAAGALAQHITRNRTLLLNQITTLADRQRKATADAAAKVTALKAGISDLLTRKGKVQKLLAKFKPQSPIVGGSGLTARMVTVRDEIDSRFGPFPTIGCFRSGDPQDHGTGTACDFMESTGGVLPTSARQAHGDQVAAWVIANATKYGIKYVIWRQRIYDMRSPGWKAMSDRGGITANHYDHVHVSVF